MMEIRLDTTCGAFAALTWGDGDLAAPVMLCLHGFPDTPYTFDSVAPLFAAGGYRVVAPWMRGYAPSTLDGPHDADQLANDILALADAVSPDRPVVLFGHDWGAIGTYGALLRGGTRIAAAVPLAVPHPLAFLRNLKRNPMQVKRSWYMFLFQVPGADFAVRVGDFALIERLPLSASGRQGGPRRPRHMADVKRCLAASLPAPIERYRQMGRDLLAGKTFPKTRIAVPTLYLHGARDGCIGAGLGAGQARGSSRLISRVRSSRPPAISCTSSGRDSSPGEFSNGYSGSQRIRSEP